VEWQCLAGSHLDPKPSHLVRPKAMHSVKSTFFPSDQSFKSGALGVGGQTTGHFVNFTEGYFHHHFSKCLTLPCGFLAMYT
jgi:hypothetical protein